MTFYRKAALSELSVDDHCYYVCSVVTGAKTMFFLWYSDETDGLVLAGTNVRTFPTRDAACEYCHTRGLPLTNESTADYDLDAIDAWIADPNSQPFDIKVLLNAWNMMDDFYKSIGTPGAIPDDVLDLHEKLSLSNFSIELPGVFTAETYEPEWTEPEQTRIARILHETTTRFKNALQSADLNHKD